MARESCSVEIEMDDPLAIAMLQKIDRVATKHQQFPPFSIFRVPDYIRKKNESCYQPRLVSIGPYHRSKEHLKAMEEHKWRSLRDFINRFPEPKEISFQTCVTKIKSLEPLVRECYFESVGGDFDFTEMMLLDGCFILELLIKWMHQQPDVMCNVGWSIPLITSDLQMLDNQIPFIVLQKLYEILIGNDDADETPARLPGARSRKPSLVDLVVALLVSGNEKVSKPKSGVQFYHLLHLYYLCFTEPSSSRKSSNKWLLCLCQVISPTWIFSLILFIYRKLRRTICHRQSSTDEDSESDPPMMIPCATDLQEAGVKFEKAFGSFRNISFSPADGVLKIPYLAIEESTTILFTNLIAFEQTRRQEKILSSYAVFMGWLVKTPKDIAILHHEGVIANSQATDEEASNFFNQLGHYSYTLDYSNHELSRLSKQVRKYCELHWPKYRTKMYREYFNSPWSILSLLAALVLLFLTVAQTYFTVFPR